MAASVSVMLGMLSQVKDHVFPASSTSDAALAPFDSSAVILEQPDTGEEVQSSQTSFVIDARADFVGNE